MIKVRKRNGHLGDFRYTTLPRCSSNIVTDYLDCAETQGCSLEGCISTTLVYLVYLVLPCFDYVLVSPFHLLYTPSSCIYRYSRATFTIKSLVQYPHTATVTYIVNLVA